MMKPFQRAAAHIRRRAHQRIRQPILVLESDDWGLRRTARTDLLARFGTPKFWARDSTENASDLTALYDTLESVHDDRGRPAVLSANFIVANPDETAVIDHGFASYHETPISESRSLVQAWREGIHRKAFYPQLHGRSHFWIPQWLDDLRRDVPGARALAAAGATGGLGLLREHGWRYHSEYVGWLAGEQMTSSETRAWVQGGIRSFQSAFGTSPRSAVAPHYVLPEEVIHVWAEHGITAIQSGNYHITRGPEGSKRILHHTLGEKSSAGTVFLIRNVKFEPCRGVTGWAGGAVIDKINWCFRMGLPAIVDTHRVNYVGEFRDHGLAALRELLAAVEPWRPLFLTSTELGEALLRQGKFNDVFESGGDSIELDDSRVSAALRILNRYSTSGAGAL